jgi:N-acetylneuraminic acid mutarotase
MFTNGDAVTHTRNGKSYPCVIVGKYDNSTYMVRADYGGTTWARNGEANVKELVPRRDPLAGRYFRNSDHRAVFYGGRTKEGRIRMYTVSDRHVYSVTPQCFNEDYRPLR